MGVVFCQSSERPHCYKNCISFVLFWFALFYPGTLIPNFRWTSLKEADHPTKRAALTFSRSHNQIRAGVLNMFVFWLVPVLCLFLELLWAFHPWKQRPGDQGVQNRGRRARCRGKPHLLPHLCSHAARKRTMDEQHQVIFLFVMIPLRRRGSVSHISGSSGRLWRNE